MGLLLPAVFDNRHEKYKWILMPVYGWILIFFLIPLPMSIFLNMDIFPILLIFLISTLPLPLLAFWYLFSIPAAVGLEPNFIYMKRLIFHEHFNLGMITKISRSSPGIMALLMGNKKEVIRVGICDDIISQIKEYHEEFILGRKE